MTNIGPNKLHILLIEDNADDAFLIEDVVHKNYPTAEILKATNKDEFVQTINGPLEFDIILSDWSLPQFSGIEALEQIKSKSWRAPFIIVSGNIGEESATEAIKQGAYDYVLKTKLSRLPAAIEHALQQRDNEEHARIDQQRIDLLARALEKAPIAIAILNTNCVVEFVNPAYEKVTGYSAHEVIGKNLTHSSFGSTLVEIFQGQIEKSKNGTSDPPQNNEIVQTSLEKRKDGVLYFEERKIYAVSNADGNISHFVVIRRDVTEIEQARKELEIQIRYSAAVRQAKTVEALAEMTVSFIENQAKDHAGELHVGVSILGNGNTASGQNWYGENPESFKKISRSAKNSRFFTYEKEIEVGDELFCLFYLSADIDSAYDLERLSRLISNEFETILSRLVIQRRATEQIRTLSFLKMISRTINSRMDFDEVMKPLLVQTKATLNGDAVALYLFEKNQNAFVAKVTEGFKTDLIRGAVVSFGQVYLGLAAQKQKIIITSNFDDLDPDSEFAKLIAQEGFLSQYCVPIVIGGKSFGVLELFQRKPFSPTPEWLNLLDAIALQMGLALDYNNLYGELQNTYLDLADSYEATLEGWSSAMDVRDHETEGHSKRVAELASALARKMGLSNDEVENIRRGALLHDIGKLGVPDSILLKNGPLTEDEWNVMKRHPQLAYRFLAKVPYLEKSLDIPRFHHERWDGNGYPSGLSGTRIPLAARLFSVVDVYDALTSERPYRHAWSKAKATQYLREQAGIQFDPEIVDGFLQMLSASSEEY